MLNIKKRHSIRSATKSGGGSRPPTPSSANNSLLNAKAIQEKKTDYKLEHSELKTLYTTSEIERLRLVDLVKTLQKRLEEQSEKLVDTENRLNEQRRRGANLEKQIERLKLQETSNAKRDGKSAANNAAKLPNSSMDQYKMEELETSLLIQVGEKI